MGKCMKESKKISEVSETEDPQEQSSLFLGVRTRAKTRALQQLGVLPQELPATESGDYMQLRNRRFEKTVSSKRKKIRAPSVSSPSSDSKGVVDSGSDVGSGQLGEEIEEEVKNDSADLGIQGSFGENVLESEETEKDKRESTPSSLPRDPDAIRTPGSSTRPANSTVDNGTARNSMPRHIPTAHDVDEFFSGAEALQQKQFMEKYNFDPVNEKPLSGRYEWVKVDP